MKKKEYTNISAIMIEYHNNVTVPFLKKIKSGSIKVKWMRNLKKRDEIEADESISRHWSYNTMNEYLLMNQFIFDLLTTEQQEAFLNLKSSEDMENKTLAGFTIYTIIEEKKKELIELYENRNTI